MRLVPTAQLEQLLAILAGIMDWIERHEVGNAEPPVVLMDEAKAALERFPAPSPSHGLTHDVQWSGEVKLVYLESPYAGDVKRNLAYAQDAIADCIERGEAPFASHILYTGALDDNDPEERRLGMEAGFAFAAKCDATVVYQDLGVSRGMGEGIRRARESGRPVEFRSLEGWR